MMCSYTKLTRNHLSTFVDLLRFFWSNILNLVSKAIKWVEPSGSTFWWELSEILEAHKDSLSGLTIFAMCGPLPLCLSTYMFKIIIEHLVPPIDTFMNSFAWGSFVVPLVIALLLSSLVCKLLDDSSYFYNLRSVWSYIPLAILPIGVTALWVFPINSFLCNLRANIRIVGDNLVKISAPEIISLGLGQYITRPRESSFDTY